MSNYCDRCQYKPDIRYGEQACPMTTLYWNFLINHQSEFNQNPRTRLMTANLSKISNEDQRLIQNHAKAILDGIDSI
jgi:deoxyribodipyrimidine photolyase-related protein